jgi:cell division protein FtsI/penicillin-binding protein 2
MKISRQLILGIAISVYAILLSGRVFTLQFDPKSQERAITIQENNQTYAYELETGRGLIYDRWGNLLATNRRVYEVGLALNASYNSLTVAQVASSILGIDSIVISNDEKYGVYDYVETHRKPKNEYGRITLARFVEPEVVAQLEAQMKAYQNDPYTDENAPSLNGLEFTPMLVRAYPEGSLASNILGYVDSHSKSVFEGNYGVEGEYDALLNGEKSGYELPRNPLKITDLPPDSSAGNLVLTIDREIQATVESILDKALEENGSESGTIVVADPETGELLAVATSGRGDANHYRTDIPSIHPFFRAIGQTYEPGSVFKVITMASALDLGAVTPETTMFDSGVYTEYGAYAMNWDGAAHGTVTMTQCMELSLNVCLAYVADKFIGFENFYTYLDRFGFLEETGVDMEGESVFPPMLPGQSAHFSNGEEFIWTPIYLVNNSFGQGLYVTVMQMIQAFTAFGNDGYMMRPHVVKSVILDGVKYDTSLTPIRQVISSETAHTLTEMLAVSVAGETSHLDIPGYRVAGKTGTGEIAVPGEGYTSALTNASFVGWGPVDDPKILVYVWFEKPTSSRWGSEVATPVFNEVFRQTAILLNLPPDDARQILSGVSP